MSAKRLIRDEGERLDLDLGDSVALVRHRRRAIFGAQLEGANVLADVGGTRSSPQSTSPPAAIAAAWGRLRLLLARRLDSARMSLAGFPHAFCDARMDYDSVAFDLPTN